LRVQGASGDRIVDVNATTTAKEVGPCNLVIISTKATDTEAAVQNARPMICPETLVLTIQNGIGNAERITKLINSQNLLIGIAEGFGASIIRPGYIHHYGWEMIHLGAYKGGVNIALTHVAATWEAAKFNVRVYEDIQSAIWGKLVCNVGFSAICAVAGLTIGQVIENPHAWQIAKSCAHEATEVAVTKAITLPYANPESWIRDFGLRIPDARPSMCFDLEAGKRSEIDSLNGAVLREARELGIKAPTNEVMTTLVKAMEDRRKDFGQAFEVI